MLEFPKPLKDVAPNEDEGESLEPGTHTVEIAGVGKVMTSNNGKPYCKVILRNDAGAIHTEYYYLTDAALWRMRQLIAAAGFLPDTVPQRTESDPLIGRRVEVDLRLDGEYVKLDRVRQIKGAGAMVPWPAAAAGPKAADEANPFKELAGEEKKDDLPF